MQSFADCLKKYLNDNNLSYSSAAKMCGIDRTLLGRYASGERIPRNRKRVNELANGLEMIEKDRRKLLEAYRRTEICREYHTSYTLIEDILEGQCQMTEKTVALNGGRKEIFLKEYAKNLYTKEEIFEMVRYILENSAWIKPMFDPEYPELQKILYDVCMFLPKDCYIEQVVGAEHYEWQYTDAKMKNLKLLLPLLFQKKSYRVYHHYQWERRSKSQIVKLNYILTDRGLVLFEHNLEIGFFTNQQQPCLYYAALYGNMRLRCRLFAEGGEEQYFRWHMKSKTAAKKRMKSGTVISKTRGDNCVWLVKEEEKCAVCIKEIGIVQLLKKFIWNE